MSAVPTCARRSAGAPRSSAGCSTTRCTRSSLPLPDETLVYPAHGAGSLCGKNLSSDTVSTIGVQRRYNYALQPMSRERVHRDRHRRSARLAGVLHLRRGAQHEGAADARAGAASANCGPLSLRRGARARSTRGAQAARRALERCDFAGAHLRGALNVGLDGSYATWAGTLLDHEHPIVLVVDPGRETRGGGSARPDRLRQRRRLSRGRDAAARGRAGADRADRAHHRRDARASSSRADAPPLLVDVRTAGEWSEAQASKERQHPALPARRRLGELPRDRPIVVHCASGYRSSIAASVLQRSGFTRVLDLVGGLPAWEAERLQPA